ncbi:hypothetical protein GCM10009075_10840 [Sphingomonas trueperi]
MGLISAQRQFSAKQPSHEGALAAGFTSFAGVGANERLWQSLPFEALGVNGLN